VYLAVGLGKQIERNTKLMEFKLVYFRLHTKVWKHIGDAVGKSKTLLSFTAQACNLDHSDNL
jgi:hypothetical protein